MITANEIKAQVLADRAGFSTGDWDALSQYRGVACKMPEQLDVLVNLYPSKLLRLDSERARLERVKPSSLDIPDLLARIPQIRAEQIELKKTPHGLRDDDWNVLWTRLEQEHRDIGELIMSFNGYSDICSKITRIEDKLASVLGEQDLRLKMLVDRLLHHTVYYIDLDAGDNGDDGLSTGNAWLTIEQYTTTTARSAGDIAYVRANTDETMGAANVVFDEDGDVDTLIYIIGCDSVTNDPWSDSSDVRPIFDFNAGSYYFELYWDNYWSIQRCDFTGTANTYQVFLVFGSRYTEFKDCRFYEGEAGVRTRRTHAYFEDCEFYSNVRESVESYGEGESIHCKSCTFNGGGDTTDNGVYAVGAVCILEDCSLGETTEHDVSDIRLNFDCHNEVNTRNTILDSTTKYSLADVTYTAGVCVYNEDYQGVSGAHYQYHDFGEIERVSGVQIDSEDTWQMSPNAKCGLLNPLKLKSDSINQAWQIWVAAEETTITVTARETAAWTSDPSSSQFRLCVSYLNHATNATRTVAYSNDSLSGVTEVDFDVTFTPSQAGWVFVWVELMDYESGKSVNVAAEPVVS